MDVGCFHHKKHSNTYLLHKRGWFGINIDMEKEKIPCGPIFNIKQAVENPQIKERNMIVKSYHKIIGEFNSAGNPIKMSNYKDNDTRGDIPDLDEHRDKIVKEFS